MGKRTTVPNKVSSLLRAGEQLSHLGRMLDKQQTLLKAIRSQLPSPLDQHCLHARVNGKQLIIYTDSPVWNARLRFHGPLILQALRQQAPHLQQIKINVHIEPAQKPPQRRQARLSRRSATRILELADSVTDPKLQAALRRLSGKVTAQ